MEELSFQYSTDERERKYLAVEAGQLFQVMSWTLFRHYREKRCTEFPPCTFFCHPNG